MSPRTDHAKRTRKREGFTAVGDLTLPLLASILINALAKEPGSLRSISRYYDRYLGFARGTSLSVIRYLLANQLIRIDMSQPINLDEHLTLQPSATPIKMIHRRIEMTTHRRLSTDKSLLHPITDLRQEANLEPSSLAHEFTIRRFVNPDRKGVIQKALAQVNHEVDTMLGHVRSKENGETSQT